MNKTYFWGVNNETDNMKFTKLTQCDDLKRCWYCNSDTTEWDWIVIMKEEFFLTRFDRMSIGNVDCKLDFSEINKIDGKRKVKFSAKHGICSIELHDSNGPSISYFPDNHVRTKRLTKKTKKEKLTTFNLILPYEKENANKIYRALIHLQKLHKERFKKDDLF